MDLICQQNNVRYIRKILILPRTFINMCSDETLPNRVDDLFVFDSITWKGRVFDKSTLRVLEVF